MNWREITNKIQIESIKEESFDKPILVFKHSSRCPISAMSLNRLERNWEGSTMIPYFLDLISYREISNLIESEFQVLHESPQALLIKNGEVAFHTSHNAIDFDELKDIASSDAQA